MNRRKGQRTKPQNATVSTLLARINHLEKQMKGGKLVPGNNPPAFTQRPWNSWTYDKAESVNYGVTVGDVINNIREKCNISATGPDGNNIISIKIQTAMIWSTSTLGHPTVEAEFYELNAYDSTLPIQDPRATLIDTGTFAEPAKIGFLWPESDQARVFTDQNATLQILQIFGASLGELTTRIKVLWKSSSINNSFSAPDSLTTEISAVI